MRYADKRVTLEFLDGRTRLLHRLVQVFLRTAPGTVEELAHAVGRGDTDEVLRLSHGLKNSAGMLCLEPLEQACLALERAARARDSGRFMVLYKELQPVFAGTEAELGREEWR